MQYNEVEGDLIALAEEGKFDVIAHGVNCMCKQEAGIAPQMVKAFGTHKFKKEFFRYRGDINKLGTIDFKGIQYENGENIREIFNKLFVLGKSNLYVVNAYTQFNYGRNHKDGTDKPLDYHALKLCFLKMNHIFQGMHIGLPKIGCGLAGGNWTVVRQLIQSTFTLCDVTVVIYKEEKKEKLTKTKIIN